MATHTGVVAAHGTTTASVVDTVTLSGSSETVTILKRSTGAELYVTVGWAGATPADPTVGGADCYPIADIITSLTLSTGAGPNEVKVISTGVVTYSVIGTA